MIRRIAAVAMFLVPALASAQTNVFSITDAVPGWGPINRFGGVEAVRGSQTIDNVYDRGPNSGSIHFSGPAGVAGGLRNRVALLNTSTGGFGLLSNLESVGFDWYRNSSSTTGGIHSPALRLFVRSGPAGAVTSELIWEHAYNISSGAINSDAPTNVWNTVSNSLTDGSWWRFSAGSQQACPTGGNAYADFYKSLSNWDGCLGSDAVVYGISVGLGGLPDAGSFDGAVDLPTLKFVNQAAQTWDFGTSNTVVPEPSTYALMAAGLAGLFAVQRRRRRA